MGEGVGDRGEKPEWIERLAERLYEADRGNFNWRWSTWRYATTRKQAEYHARAEAIANLVDELLTREASHG